MADDGGSGQHAAPGSDRSASTHPAAPAAPTPRVIAVVVAYNRRDLLIRSLDALAAQQRPADGIVVIDNASTDDTADVARHHPARPEVLRLETNTGGAGGFAAGIAHAIGRMGAEAVWLMDDDTIPTPTALGALVDACEHYPGPVAVAGSRVVWTDGRDHPMNTPRVRPGASAAARAAASAVGALPIRSTSFVSMLVSTDAVRRVGLPLADYFIWNDDFEYSTRLLRNAVGLHVRGSVVEHWTKTFGATDADPGARFYYEVRNKIWMLCRSRSLGPMEKVLYGGSTLRRWVRTFVKSSSRKTLLGAALRGAKDSLRPPRPTGAVLADVGMTSTLDDFRRAIRWTDPTPASAEPLPFSVLLPVYAGDRAEFLRRAYDSATVEQQRPPNEVVIVRDGPVGPELEEELADIERRSTVPVRVLRLAENGGLARALTVGLAECRHEVIARADADDVSLPERFAVQLPVIEAGADLVGSALVEFADDENDLGALRLMPTDPDEIARRARIADPFNHPSVVFRKSAVRAAGGYEHLHLMEDYLLFARMIGRGAAVANVPDVLVKYRVGAGSYARRGGRALFKAEVALQGTLRRERFVSTPQYARNVVVRGGYRLVPESARRVAYRTLVLRGRRSRGEIDGQEGRR